MKTSLIFAIFPFFAFSIFGYQVVRADDRQPPRPGTLNYVEGHAYLGSQALSAASVGNVVVDPGETLATGNGKAEILLTPGVFVRLGEQSSATMISSGLTNTRMSLDQGEALIEVAQIYPENDLRIQQDGKSTQLLKAGLYDFNENLHAIRVLDGEARLAEGGRYVTIKGGHMVDLAVSEPIKVQKFDKKNLEAEDLYRWTTLRSAYLAEANADSAPNYSLGGFGWFGDGWYWNPWFDAYTFLPGDGIFYSPFGWGFYSPWCAYEAPFYGGHFYHHFNPTNGTWGPEAHYEAPKNYGRGVQYGPRLGGGVLAGRSRAGFFSGRGVHGGNYHSAGSFHGGAGFHGGGGGFHGGGGGGGHH